MLMQLNLDKKLYLIVFNNRKLTRAKLNYLVHKKKLLAIKYTL
jgi:hypothetical protein